MSVAYLEKEQYQKMQIYIGDCALSTVNSHGVGYVQHVRRNKKSSELLSMTENTLWTLRYMAASFALTIKILELEITPHWSSGK